MLLVSSTVALGYCNCCADGSTHPRDYGSDYAECRLFLNERLMNVKK
jgi:hypothetical protein